MVEQLTPAEQRVIGVLLEKQRAVPDTYPMTLNGVISASNQSSGRDPAMSLSEQEVTEALGSLRQRELTRRVLPSHGARTEKYRQVADEVWRLDDAERAVVTLLLLRGPQTPGELKSRANRLHEFADLDEVHQALASLAARDEPLVVQHELQAGRKERRWGHVLGPHPGTAVDDPTDGTVRGPPEAGRAGQATDVDPPGAASTAVEPLHPDLAPLAPLVGTWSGTGSGDYPTIDPFDYEQTIELAPMPGKPMLAYRSTTSSAADGRPLHAEVGWLRIVAPGAVELLVAQAPGLLEATEGVVDTDDGTCAVVMSSSATAATTTAKSLTATEREYAVDGDELSYRISMSAVGEPLTQHLTATLHRVNR